jgi:guanine deaminase
MFTIIKGNIINPIGRIKTEIMHDAALIINKGKIIEYLKYSEAEKKYQDYNLIDYSGKYISPGFIDIHLHAPQVNQRARYGETLMQWLEKFIFLAEESFADLQKADKEIDDCLHHLIKNGTTTAVMYSSHHKEATDLLFQKCNKRGIKAFAGKVMMDFALTGEAFETTEESLQQSYDLYKKWDGYDNGRLKYIFSPRFAPVCSENLLTELGNLATAENVYIQSHLAENKEEIAAALNIFFGYSSYTDIYFRTGILTPKTIMGHCIHLSEDEFHILKDTDCKIAHCPSSNFFLKSGRFDFHNAERKGISLGLGSDVGAGPSFSLFDVMKSMNFIQPFHICPQKTYYYSTLGNAKALSIDNQTGNFSAGKDADFIVIDIFKGHPTFNYNNVEDLLAFLIYLGNSSFIEATYVRGKNIS